MLQEATKILGSAFKDSFIKRLALYLHDCVREEVKSSTFRNLNQDKDNKWVFLKGTESFLSNPDSILTLDGADTSITELMVQADISQKDRYLIYGYLFLHGKNPRRKSEDFLTPLLYLPCKLERNGININCTITDETLSLNTGALSGLMKYDDEDEIEHLFEGLIDVIPDLPLTQEKIQVFLITLKSLIPTISIEDSIANIGIQKNDSNNDDVLNPDLTQIEDFSRVKDVSVINAASIILTKRPTITAGVLHELTQIGEKPNGVFRETVLSAIQEEFIKASKNKTLQATHIFDNKKPEKLSEIYPITPLELSDSQKDVIEAISKHQMVNVYGPPGTGKSQTIVNLVSHLVASGKTVLVASRMDKAVDVVSERLNGLGAPFLCLRAGRPNYQKQLNFQLQDLLSNKVDIDTGYESAVLAEVEDMKNLFKLKTEIEKKCEKILKLEEEWTKSQENYANHLETSEDNLSINKDLLKTEVESIKKLLAKVEKFAEKGGFIYLLIAKILFKYIAKKLKVSELSLSSDSIINLNKALLSKELLESLKNIENEITKTGNLHQLLEDLKESRGRQKNLSVDILKNQRRESLKSLIRDQFKRQRLIIHSKALVERKKNLQNRLLHEEDFNPLLEAFPCWAVTTYAISESLPLKPGLFDVAIIDEASQCDIASCFPVLFRAKSAIIVGDDKQLPHLSFLEKAKEQSFLSQYDIPDRYQLMWRFRTNSVFDLANFYSSKSVLLDEHFRSHPDIINFSNKEFYGDRIRIMNKNLPFTENKSHIELIVVNEAKVDLDSTRNMAETEKIMEKLQEIIMNDKNLNSKKPVSIGIISPFRGQVELLKKAINQVFTEEIVKKHSIEVGTAHTFQGDERDIILLSFTLASNSHFQSLTFLQKPNLFNVAITRARKKLVCFISRPIESIQPGLLRTYLEYIQSLEKKYSKPKQETFKNSLEKEIIELCKEENFNVYPNKEICGFNIDLLITDNQNSLALFCDGIESSEKNYEKDIWKQGLLERCGWKVMRITAREWKYSSKACMNRIKTNLK